MEYRSLVVERMTSRNASILTTATLTNPTLNHDTSLDLVYVRPLALFWSDQTNIFREAYTSFSYANLSVSGAPAAAVRSAATADQTQAELYQSTGHSIEVTITNTGKVAGKEIAQLYLSFPSIEGIDFPPQQLRGFRKVSLEPGESKSVQFALRKKDISYWSVATQKWEPVVGKVGVKVAGSSRIEGATGELIM